MSDEKQDQQEPEQEVKAPEPQHECEFCGHNGFYGTLCPDCKRPITQRRQYTISEYQSGRAPDPNRGRPSGAPPTIVEVPGSMPVRKIGK